MLGKWLHCVKTVGILVGMSLLFCAGPPDLARIGSGLSVWHCSLPVTGGMCNSLHCAEAVGLLGVIRL